MYCCLFNFRFLPRKTTLKALGWYCNSKVLHILCLRLGFSSLFLNVRLLTQPLNLVLQQKCQIFHVLCCRNFHLTSVYTRRFYYFVQCSPLLTKSSSNYSSSEIYDPLLVRSGGTPEKTLPGKIFQALNGTRFEIRIPKANFVFSPRRWLTRVSMPQSKLYLNKCTHPYFPITSIRWYTFQTQFACICMYLYN